MALAGSEVTNPTVTDGSIPESTGLTLILNNAHDYHFASSNYGIYATSPHVQLMYK